MASDDVRKEAFDRAMETGEVMASRKIHLLRNQSEAGFMMVLPIYKKDISVSTLAERKATIQGFVAHVISAKDFFGHSVIQSKEIAQIDFEIFDSEDMTAQNVIFNFDNELHVIDKNYKSRFTVCVPIYIAERKFMMHYTASQNFGLDDGQERVPYWILGVGIFASFLFFYVMRVLATAEVKARQVADKKTKEVELLLESSVDGIYGINLEGQCTFINQAALKMLGYELGEALGKNIHHLVHYKKSNGSPYPIGECPIYQTFKSGASCRVDNEVLWRKDGTFFPATKHLPDRVLMVMVGIVVVLLSCRNLLASLT